MSSLNLDPNSLVLATQLGVFLGAVVCVKKLMLEPYLKVKEKRDRLTIGNQSDADALLEKNEQIKKQIDEKIQGAYEMARVIKAESLKKAEDESSRIISVAENEVSSLAIELEKEITASLKEESQKIPQTVESLSAELYAKVVR